MTSLSNIFKFIRLLSYVACVLFSSSAFSQALPETSSKSQSIKKPTLGYQEACILGLVQGVTEFLPISSTGHLIISAHFLNLDNPLKDPEPYNIAEPTIPINSSSVHPEILEKKTGFKQAINAYMIVIQAGSILAILFLYPKKVKSICFGLLGKDRVGAQLIRNLFFALLPSSILGLLLEKYVDRYLLNIPCVLIALVAGAGIIFAVECWRARKIGAKNSRSGLEGHQLGILPCMFIGCMQVFSMWPGMSRSMMTLTACYLVGLRPIQAAEFSFLLGLVTLSLASGYKIVSSGSNMLQYLQLDTMFIGVGIAFIASLVCVKGLVQYLTHHGLHVFAWYRLFLAMVLGVTYYIA